MTRADYTLAVHACLDCCVHGPLIRLAARRGHCVSRCCRLQVAFVHVATGLGSSRRSCVATLFLFPPAALLLGFASGMCAKSYLVERNVELSTEWFACSP